MTELDPSLFLHPDDEETTYQYDDLDRLVEQTGPSSTTYQYDILGNLTETRDALQNQTAYTYDHLGNRTSETDPNGDQILHNYDFLGRLTSVTDAANDVTTYGYDDLDRQTTDTIVLPVPVSGSDQVVNTPYTRTSLYDLAGNLRKYTDRDGRVQTFAYDNADRLTTEEWLDDGQTVYYIFHNFNQAGQLTNESESAYSPAGSSPGFRVFSEVSTYDYTYDAGRLKTVSNGGTQQSIPQVQLSYEYNSLGQRTSVTASGGDTFVTNYEYDDVGRLTDVDQPSSRSYYIGSLQVAEKWVHLTYDEDDRLKSISRLDDLSDSLTQAFAKSVYTYDDESRVKSLTHTVATTNAGQTTFSHNWTYNAKGQAETYSYQAGSTTQKALYGYDDRGQLESVDNSGTGAPADQTFQFDSGGNRYLSDGTPSAPSGTFNRIASDGTYSYKYDPEGNRISRTNLQNGQFTKYEWDYRNRLVKVTDYASEGGSATQAVQYTYDANDRRIVEAVDTSGPFDFQDATYTYFVYDGSNVIADFTASSATATPVLAHRYMYGDGVNQLLAQEDITDGASEDVEWPLTDNQGTLRDLFKTYYSFFGNLQVENVAHYNYDAFGNPVGLTAQVAQLTRYLYAGNEWDSATKLEYMGGDWYDPRTGAWLSTVNVTDTNAYRYEGNDPINSVADRLRRGAAAQMAALTDRAETMLDPATVNLMTPREGDWLDKSSDFSAAMADKITGGLTQKARAAMGYDYIVDKESDAYRYGGYAGQAVNIALIAAGLPATTAAWAVASLRVVNAMTMASSVVDATRAAVAGDPQQAALMLAGGMLSMTRGLGSWSGWKNTALAAGQISLHAYGSGQAMVGAYQKYQQGDYIGAALDAVESGVQGYRTFIGCFAAGTLMLTPEGSKAIEKFQVGDRIISRSENGADRPVVVSFVEELFVREAWIVELRIGNETIRTTPEHPFWVDGKGWTPVNELSVGDYLLSDDGQHIPVEAIVATGELETVYNFRVAAHHTYFVGSEEWGFSVWSHNARCAVAAKPIDDSRPIHGQIEHDATAFNIATKWAGKKSTVEARFNQALVDTNGIEISGLRPDAQRIRKTAKGLKVDVTEVRSEGQSDAFMDRKIAKFNRLLGRQAGVVKWIDPTDTQRI